MVASTAEPADATPTESPVGPEAGPTRLVLVRHGESQANVDRVAGGLLGCRGLTDGGRRQAEQLARRLRTTDELGLISAVYSSTLPRAIETAEIVAPAIGDLAVRQDAALCELDPGEADGLTWAEFQRRFGGAPALAVDPYRPIAPGGESWAAFQLRVGAAVTRITAAHAGATVVAACHNGVIEASFSVFLGLGLDRTSRSLGLAAFTSLTEWIRTDEAGHPPSWRLVRYNDAAHLRT